MTRTVVLSLLSLSSVLASGCSSSDPASTTPPTDTGTTPVDSAACATMSGVGLTSEADSTDKCPALALELTGTKATGATCADTKECAPVCCTCPGSGKGALVAMCNGGVCQDKDTVCCLYARAICK